MANKEKGEIDWQIGGRSLILCLPTNSIVEVEDLLGRDIVTIVSELDGSPRFGTIRALLWGALRRHHPALSLIDVGDLLDEIGSAGLADVGGKLGEAIRFRLSGGDTGEQRSA